MINNTERYLKFAKTLAHEAGEIALRYFGFETERTWKADNTPLTQADIEINKFIIEKVSSTFPDHSIKGEEEGLIKKGSHYVWLCDPIDGTTAFSCGMPTFVFSIALVDQSDGQPVIGLVYDPIMKIMYWATEGGGAFRNGRTISVSKQSSFENSYATIGGSGRGVELSSFQLMEALSERKCKVMKFPSFIYGSIQVANGTYIGAALFVKNAHDVAALKIITEEAGGVATDLEGKGRRYDEDGLGFVISNGLVHQELLELIKQIRNA